ncbi:hypothetical protein [Thermococcus sp.]|uniref:hypothetical protein n=1 Tax=Thermococcus sp. TaxID=35749 RepID=UPI00262C3CC2|nr:hypothetical protein [Thermococcus sp.]
MMKWKELPRFLTLVVAVLAGLGVQARLVQVGHQEFIYGYVLGALVYQTLSDPQWLRKITEPDEFVSLMMWVFFPFVATLATMWRIMMEE